MPSADTVQGKKRTPGPMCSSANTSAAGTATPQGGLPIGVFPIGERRVLVTDLRVFDAAGDHAVVVEHPDPALVAKAQRASARWRETIGAFQLGIPVSVKGEMLAHHLRLLSVLRWRAERLRRESRWHATFTRYVGMIADKVRALGGDPWTVPATPDGRWPGLDDGHGPKPGGQCGDVGSDGMPHDEGFEPGGDAWLDATNGLPPLDQAKPAAWSGKISGLLFDHFGDFEGFMLETYAGAQLRFHSRETAIRDLADGAWRERTVVTVITVAARSRRVRPLLLRV